MRELLTVAALVAMVGCGGGDKDSGDSGGDPATTATGTATGGTATGGTATGGTATGTGGGTGTGTGTGSAPITLNMLVFDALTVEPIEGAEVCDSASAACATTGAAGDATLEVSGDLPLLISAELAGTYRRHIIDLTPVDVAGGFPMTMILVPDTALPGLLGAYGVTENAAMGHALNVVDGPGATLALDVATDGPLYLDDIGGPNPSQESVSAQGGVAFANIPPGMATATAELSAGTCTAAIGQGGANHTFTVEAGAVTNISGFTCE
ncbi:MAG: hypothetical protein ACI8PZ_003585 [Myxococcota bacterium]|jgi:hypothetical protein